MHVPSWPSLDSSWGIYVGKNKKRMHKRTTIKSSILYQTLRPLPSLNLELKLLYHYPRPRGVVDCDDDVVSESKRAVACEHALRFFVERCQGEHPGTRS